MSESEENKKYLELIRCKCNKIKYYPKTNFINMIRVLSNYLPCRYMKNWLNENSHDELRFHRDWINSCYIHGWLPEPSDEIIDALLKPWVKMNQKERESVLLFFNILPSFHHDREWMLMYGYKIYFAIDNFTIEEYYKLNENEKEIIKISDCDLNLHRSLIEKLFTNEQKIRFNASLILSDQSLICRVEFSVLNDIVKKYQMLEPLNHFSSETKLIIASNTSIQDIMKMIEYEKIKHERNQDNVSTISQ